MDDNSSICHSKFVSYDIKMVIMLLHVYDIYRIVVFFDLFLSLMAERLIIASCYFKFIDPF